jgi:hypothetical protein
VRAGGRDEEWVALSETDDMKSGKKTQTQLRRSESKERILGTGNGIAITKTVEQDFTYAAEDPRLGGGSRGS